MAKSILKLLHWKPAVESMPKTEHSAVTRETEFAVLPDGRMLDLAADPRQPTKLSFLVWEDGTVRRASHIEHEGELLVPLTMEPTVLSAIRLASEASPCPEVRQLFSLIEDAIARYVDLTVEGRFLVAAFIVATWFADQIPIFPYISICGPPESGKTTLMRLLHCLSRRPIHASAITPASIYRLAKIRPTLLMDEADFATDRTSRDLQRLLRGANRQGSYVICNGKAFQNFYPKVLASRFPLGDAAFLSRNIFVTMVTSNLDLPFGPDEENELAAKLQPMLQTFRFSHYGKVAQSQNPQFLKFPARLRDNARALATGMLGDGDLEESLVRALEPQTEFMTFDRFGEPEWVVMLALFYLSHFRLRNDIYVKEITEKANSILCENGERIVYLPRKVGDILTRCLGFSKHRVGEGWRLQLTVAVARQIHDRAKSMGITHSDIHPSVHIEQALVAQRCVLCTELGMMVDRDGRRLRTFDDDEFIARVPKK